MSISSTGRLAKIYSDYKKLSNASIDVGIVKKTLYRKKGKSVNAALVLAVQEKGSRKNNVPARATLEPAARDAKYAPRVKNLIGNISQGNGLIGLDKIGEVVSLKVKSNIQGIKTPALKKETIRNRVNKGTTNPLVDEGKLKKAIGYKVNMR